MNVRKKMLSAMALGLVLTLGATAQAREPQGDGARSERGAEHGERDEERAEKGRRGGPMAMLFASEEQFAKMQQHRQERTQHLREILQLNPAQDKSWQALQSANAAKLKQGRSVVASLGMSLEQIHDLPLPQRIDTMEQLRAQLQPIMTSSSDELKAFYAQLNPAQKKIMDEKFPTPMGH